MTLQLVDLVNGRKYVLADGVEIKIGRSPSNDIVVPTRSEEGLTEEQKIEGKILGGYVSAKHATILAHGGTARLLDLDSTNGTYLISEDGRNKFRTYIENGLLPGSVIGLGNPQNSKSYNLRLEEVPSQ